MIELEIVHKEEHEASHGITWTFTIYRHRLTMGDCPYLARRTESDLPVNVRLAIWDARRVLHLVAATDRQACEDAIAAAETWLSDAAHERGLEEVGA